MKDIKTLNLYDGTGSVRTEMSQALPDALLPRPGFHVAAVGS